MGQAISVNGFFSYKYTQALGAQQPCTPLCAWVQGSKLTYTATIYKLFVTVDTTAMYTFQG